MAKNRPIDLDRDSFTREIKDAIQASTRTTARDFSIVPFVAKLFDIQRRYKVVSTTDFQTSGLALVVLEGLIRHHDPTLEFQREARPYLIRASIRGAHV